MGLQAVEDRRDGGGFEIHDLIDEAHFLEGPWPRPAGSIASGS